MKIIKVLGVVLACGLTLQMHYALKHGFGFHNGIGNVIWLALLAGIIGLLVINIYAIIKTGGSTLTATSSQMRNAFFGAFITVGLLVSLQTILALNGSNIIFLPSWFKTFIYIVLGTGVFGWIILAAFYSIASSIDMLRAFMTKKYAWIIFGVVLAFLLGLFVIFKDTSFSFFKKEDALITFDEKDKVKKTAKDTVNADASKAEAEQEKNAKSGGTKTPTETEQIISDKNGVTVSQTLVDGKLVQRINDDEPD
jgi:hypothetical protein